MWLWGQPVFDSILMGGYLGLMSLMWSALVLGVHRWGRNHRLARPPGPPPEDGPKVSICIPARNEADNIEACVEAARALRWPRLDIVVIDDRSTDDTAARARAAAEGDPRVQVVMGTAPPQGWSGKAWACARASGEARGDVLVFVDADVTLHEDAVRAVVAAMDARALDLFSAFGTWRLESFWENVVIPPVGWLIRGSIDLDAVNAPGREEAFANGQLIAVRRAAYEEADGHPAVRATILDDVALATAVQRRGFSIGLVDAPWLFEVRLYRSLREIVAGYSKNLFEGMDRRLSTGVGAVFFIFVGTLFPYLAIALGLFARWGLGWSVPGFGWVAWFAAICVLQVAFRIRLDRRDGRSAGLSWTHALGNLVLVWILVRSIVGMETEWKGRRFVDGRPSAD